MNLSDRTKALWGREVERVLSVNRDYCVIGDEELEEVIAIQYTLLAGLCVFSDYTKSLALADEMGLRVSILSFDEIIKRFEGKFDFVELDVDFSKHNNELSNSDECDCDVDEHDEIGETESSSSNESTGSESPSGMVDVNHVIEIFDRRLSSKLADIDRLLDEFRSDIPRIANEFVDSAFAKLQERMDQEAKDQADKIAEFGDLFKELSDDMNSSVRAFIAEGKQDMDRQIKDGIKVYFSQKTARGNKKGISF